MLNPELWMEGLTTMVVGMGIVFSFLVILVFAIHIMTSVVNVVNKLCPVVEPEVKQVKNSAKSDDAEVALVIACAYQNK